MKIKALYFKNDKCGVCVAFLPKMKRISEEYSLELEVVDVVEKPEIAGQNMVFTVPTIIFLDDEGNELKRFARNFSEFEIREYIQRMYDILGIELDAK
ncbi:thioredoxin family protein [Fervidobacterium islandicum]|uniref:Thioredoxin family protein n=1 Tax=Fervidobacterium islandicum TaxID=2423 RepID=A0AAI8CMP3_FERIS|nr:thioredoxin family protein [Fervidobacterium islandicum]AMW33050.1 thioredoxin family protein [Fervidobacterium islandicum]